MLSALHCRNALHRTTFVWLWLPRSVRCWINGIAWHPRSKQRWQHSWIRWYAIMPQHGTIFFWLTMEKDSWSTSRFNIFNALQKSLRELKKFWQMCIKQTWRFPRLFFYPVTRENYGRYRASVDNPVRLGYVSFVSGDRAPLPGSLFLIKFKIIWKICNIDT